MSALFEVTTEDIARLTDEEFETVWRALGLVVRARLPRPAVEPEPAPTPVLVVPVEPAPPRLTPKGPPGGRPTKCPECGQAMGSVAGLAAHRRSRHPVGKPKAAPTIEARLASEAERISAVAADIRAREPAVRAETDAFATRRQDAAKARADAAWRESHEATA